MPVPVSASPPSWRNPSVTDGASVPPPASAKLREPSSTARTKTSRLAGSPNASKRTLASGSADHERSFPTLSAALNSFPMPDGRLGATHSQRRAFSSALRASFQCFLSFGGACEG